MNSMKKLIPFAIAGTVGLSAAAGYYSLLNDSYITAAIGFVVAIPLAVYSAYDSVYKNKFFPQI